MKVVIPLTLMVIFAISGGREGVDAQSQGGGIADMVGGMARLPMSFIPGLENQGRLNNQWQDSNPRRGDFQRESYRNSDRDGYRNSDRDGYRNSDRDGYRNGDRDWDRNNRDQRYRNGEQDRDNRRDQRQELRQALRQDVNDGERRLESRADELGDTIREEGRRIIPRSIISLVENIRRTR